MGAFRSPDQLASYLGIVPSEHTTGSQRRLGSITKAAPRTPAGCWSRHPGTTAAAPRSVKHSSAANAATRRDHQHLLESATPAQRPLAPTRRHRRKPGGIVAVAIARELAAYCWEIATIPTALSPTPTPTTRRKLTSSR